MGEAAPRLNSRCHVANGMLWTLAKCRSDIRAHRFTYWFQAVPRISRDFALAVCEVFPRVLPFGILPVLFVVFFVVCNAQIL